MPPRSWRIRKHSLLGEGTAHDDEGRELPPRGPRQRMDGRAKCECGAMSEPLKGRRARERWYLQVHVPAMEVQEWATLDRLEGNPVVERLLLGIQRDGEHLRWVGGRLNQGYGTICVDGRNQQVHRVTYELLVGPIPADYDLDHLCGVRNCIRPSHLEPVTHAENVRRALERPDCSFGHAMTPENVYIAPKTGKRQCRECRRRRHREHAPRRNAVRRMRRQQARSEAA